MLAHRRWLTQHLAPVHWSFTTRTCKLGRRRVITDVSLSARRLGLHLPVRSLLIFLAQFAALSWPSLTLHPRRLLNSLGLSGTSSDVSIGEEAQCTRAVYSCNPALDHVQNQILVKYQNLPPPAVRDGKKNGFRAAVRPGGGSGASGERRRGGEGGGGGGGVRAARLQLRRAASWC